MSVASLQAVVLDFDGVIADTEPLHLKAFQETLGPRGVALTRADYYARYLGYDDGDVFRALGREGSLAWSEEDVARLVRDKAGRYRARLVASPPLFPGVADRLREWSSSVPLAIASGAFREEIEIVLEGGGLRELMSAIVAAGETPRGKPAPDPFCRALDLLGAAIAARGGAMPDPARTVAVEDSTPGIAAAHAAGMKVVALTTSHPPDRLTGADLVARSLSDLTLEAFERVAAVGRE